MECNLLRVLDERKRGTKLDKGVFSDMGPVIHEKTLTFRQGPQESVPKGCLDYTQKELGVPRKTKTEVAFST